VFGVGLAEEAVVRRVVAGALVAVIALAAVVALVGAPAGAQQAPAEDPSCDAGAYPPPTAHMEPGLRLSLDNGRLQPGTSSGNFTLIGAQPGGVYSSTVVADPGAIDVPARTADSTGTVHFTGVVVPQVFRVDATHVLFVYRQGCLAASFDPCVGPQGQLLSTCPAGVKADKGSGTLPRTGLARLEELLRAAGVAFAAGTLLLYARRRRAANVAAA
jgi:LPXTG-motif cell wall-anchored protein